MAIFDNPEVWGWRMIRALLTAAITVAAIQSASAAAADPANPICVKVASGTICEQDVPGMHYDVVGRQPCINSNYHYIYGRGQNGETLACVAARDGVHGVWSQSAPLFGVQPVGGPCPSGIGGAVAQAPDGRSLVCAEGQGWVPGP